MDSTETLDSKFSEWLERKCSEDGFSRKGLSEALGLPVDAISKVITGVRQLKASELELARRYFGEDCFHEDQTSDAVVQVVETGTYRHQQIGVEIVESPLITPRNFPGLHIYLNKGYGMNALQPRPIFDGDYVVCSPCDEATFDQLKQDMVVVVARTIPAYSIVEYSIRQVEIVNGSAIELYERSTRKNRKLNDDVIRVADEKNDVKLLGLVGQIVATA
jgi:hypothetical protein